MGGPYDSMGMHSPLPYGALENGIVRGRKREFEGFWERVVKRRQKRMIKNRESVASGRPRKATWHRVCLAKMCVGVEGGLFGTVRAALPDFPYGDKDDEEDYEEAPPPTGRRRRDTEIQRDCPYLDTVNRQVLDFDFEKFCSVSLSNLNVYACLVCGKYFQGRGRNSHAYTHSLEASHHVFINLLTEKVYCLPNGYEVNDPSLDDIRHVLYPRFTQAQVNQLDRNKKWARALDGSDYLQGMVGLKNSRKSEQGLTT
ncbi:hypothetical protein L7F22_024709 [Adiantum nelumboides]|nr:hypothetical protein [Adiantum nelumboides]